MYIITLPYLIAYRINLKIYKYRFNTFTPLRYGLKGKAKEDMEKVGKLRKLILCVINKVVLSRRRKELIPPAYLVVVVMSSNMSSSEGIA